MPINKNGGSPRRKPSSPDTKRMAWLLAIVVIATAAYLTACNAPKDGGGQRKRLPDFGPKQMAWLLTIIIIATAAYLTIFVAPVPDEALVAGEAGKPLNLIWFTLSVSPGQTTAYQVIGAVIIMLGLVPRLHRRHINRTNVTAAIGTIAIMAGLLIQLGSENILLLYFTVAWLFYLVLTWFLMAVYYGLQWMWGKISR